MKRAVLLFLAVLLLTTGVSAAADGLDGFLPSELTDPAPREILPRTLSLLGERVRSAVADALREETRGAVRLVLLALVCALAAPLEREGSRLVPLLGVLVTAVLAAGRLDAMLCLGAATAEELGTLAHLLLPTIAAAMAAGGLAATAGAVQVTTLFASDAFAALLRALLLPLIGCCVGLASAEAILGDGRLGDTVTALEKLIARVLTGLTLAFTVYLKLTGVLAGSADRAAAKAAKAAVAAFIPVIGGILSEAADGVLAGAAALRGTLGALGVAAIVLLCAAPMTRLAFEYLLFRFASFAAALIGVREVQRFLARLGTAFSLLLALTAAQAAMLLVSLLVAATASVGG